MDDDGRGAVAGGDQVATWERNVDGAGVLRTRARGVRRLVRAVRREEAEAEVEEEERERREGEREGKRERERERETDGGG